MGRAVEQVARERGHEVAARFDEYQPLPEAAAPDLGGADVAIDFTAPGAAVGNIRKYCRWGLPAVVGTTGWYERLDEVRGLVAEAGAALLYAPNFSVGVQILVRALAAVAPLLDAFPEYDLGVHEWHHVRKVDSPSGTALQLAGALLGGVGRKTRLETETQHGRIAPEALHVTSSRVGEVIGRHIVTLDSAFDALELKHEAKGRTGFAFGAVRAAEWLPGKTGLFTLDDVLEEMLAGPSASPRDPLS